MDDSSNSSSALRQELGLNDDSSLTSEIQLVRGLTFDTATRYLGERFGAERWEGVLAALPEQSRELVRGADSNEWYAESELRRLIHVVHADLAGGDNAQFLEIARGLAMAGISRFFRVIINLSSARFVLRKVPLFWKRLRRGPATLEAEVTDDGRVLIHYHDYVYCFDEVYRQLSVANCQALVLASAGIVPATQVILHDRSSMTLAFTLPSKQGATPAG